MNPRQRRGVLLMSVAALGAVAVFVLIINYVSGISRQVGPMTTSYRFTKSITQLTPITADDLEKVQLPTRWLPSAAIQSFDTSRGLVATANIPAGALLQQGMAGPPPELKPGQLEMAIMINAETGVAGKIHPGDLVDIYGTFSTQETSGQGGTETLTQARVIVANAPVLAIGALQRVDATPKQNGSSQFEQNEVVPVTFALNRTDSLKVTYAESFATKVRLALVAPGTRSKAPTRADVLDQSKVFGPTPGETGQAAP
jgi:pilus assembly protein CpaB